MKKKATCLKKALARRCIACALGTGSMPIPHEQKTQTTDKFFFFIDNYNKYATVPKKAPHNRDPPFLALLSEKL